MGGDIFSGAWWRGFAGRWGRRLWGVRGRNRLMLNGGTGCGWWGRRKRRGRRLLILVVAVLVIRIILLGIVGAVGGRVARRRGCTVPNGEGGKVSAYETHTTSVSSSIFTNLLILVHLVGT